MYKNLPRKECEKLYIKKMTELQIIWNNPLSDDWDFSDWTDEQLSQGLEDIIGQLRFEKGMRLIKKIVLYPIYLFILLGVTGLLLFGIKQLI